MNPLAGNTDWTPRIEAVVMGGSAGSVEALTRLLPALPSNLRVPLIVVLHLPRERPSLLASIFQTSCAACVHEATDKEPIEPGTIYFAPPDYHLLVDEGPALALSVDAPVHFSRPSIDVLFESAADVYGSALLGIILTGGNEDGAKGLRTISEAGGVTVVQKPQDAQVPLMPEAALQKGPADFVLTLDEIGWLLRSFQGDEGMSR